MRPAHPTAHTIWIRLLLMFLLIVLPIFSMGLALYSSGVRLQDQLVESAISQQPVFELQSLRARMASLQEALLHLSNEEETSRLSGMPFLLSDWERARALNGMQARLRTIQLSSAFVRQITLYLPAVDKRLLAVSYRTEVTTIDALDEAELAEQARRARAAGSQTQAAADGIFYYYQLPSPSPRAQEALPRALFFVEYDTVGIAAALSQSISELSMRFALLNEDGEILLTNAAEPARTAALQGLADWSGQTAFQRLRLGSEAYYVLAIPDALAGARALFYIPREAAMASAARYQGWVWALTGALALGIVLYGLFAMRSVQKPVTLLASGFRRLERGDLDFAIAYRGNNEFRYLVDRFNKTLVRLKEVLAQLYDQRLLTQQAEMKHLQAQINPHFLYNNFYILDNMILMEDFQTASEFCRLLGAYFQYVTHSDALTARLSEELRHAQAYARIQRMRFGARLTLDFPDPPPSFPDPEVPRLILQPLLENAFKHALEDMEGQGFLSVQYAAAGDTLHLRVENSGPLLSEEAVAALRETLDQRDAARRQTGLSNVHQRLRIALHPGLSLSPREGGGLAVTLTLNIGR